MPTKLKVTIATAISLLMAVAMITIIKNKLDSVRLETKQKAYNSLHHFYLKQVSQAKAPIQVIIGDSHVQSMNVSNISPSLINLGIGGDTLKGVAERLSDYQKEHTLEQIILLAGANDLLSGISSSELEARALHLSKKINNKQTFFWVAIPSISSKRPAPDLTPKANTAIKNICLSRPNCTFIPPLDITPASPTNLQHPDGVHLTAKGYKYLASTIRDYIIRGLANSD